MAAIMIAAIAFIVTVSEELCLFTGDFAEA